MKKLITALQWLLGGYVAFSFFWVIWSEASVTSIKHVFTAIVTFCIIAILNDLKN